jgi:hypothetical protein
VREVAVVGEAPGVGHLREIFAPPYRARMLMLAVFNFFQTVGFYGFGNWVPRLIEASGADVLKSLQYAVAIAVAYPVGPLLCLIVADRFERKSQIVAAAIGTASFGLLFAALHAPAMMIVLGVLITISNNLLSYAYHAYQAELFPTRIRARAVGFVYSWSLRYTGRVWFHRGQHGRGVHLHRRVRAAHAGPRARGNRLRAARAFVSARACGRAGSSALERRRADERRRRVSRACMMTGYENFTRCPRPVAARCLRMGTERVACR